MSFKDIFRVILTCERRYNTFDLKVKNKTLKISFLKIEKLKKNH